MVNLNTLKNTTVTRTQRRRVGRGPGSGLGKTCGRGEKGAGSRSGYKRRHGYEGGQFRLYMKLPIRGFSNKKFQKKFDAVNLDAIERCFEDGETVNIETLVQFGLIPTTTYGVKILGKGELKKKVTIEAHAFSDSAKEKLQNANIAFTTLPMGQAKSEQ